MLPAALALVSVSLGSICSRADTPPSTSPYARWEMGPPHEAGFFPLAVWLQNPAKAERYRDARINTYVGLWKGPTEEQLERLSEAGMKVICHQNEVGLAHVESPTIIGWMHGDEPDNAQPLGEGKGYGPPIPPARIVEDYEQIRERDPSRPIFLNLGQGVAWDAYHGRGVRTNHPEDYPEYLKGCDIASFDIYPVVHPSTEVAGKLWYVARGVERLVEWTDDDQIVWNCIECTRISNPDRKATPAQVRSEVWMAIIHGSMGIIYFVHEWEPRFNEAALLDDAEMLAAVTATNRRITELAPVLNSPSLPDAATAASDDPDIPIAVMVKRHGGATYLFAAAMRDGACTATFTLRDARGEQTIEVLDEDRTLEARDGFFTDRFESYGVHLYRIK